MTTLSPSQSPVNVEHFYGWHPSLPDLRNEVSNVDGLKILDEVDPRGGMPDPYDQGQLGSCTGNALAAAKEYNDILDGCHSGTPSRLFIYYGEREREGTIDTDSGAYGHDGFKVMRKTGVPQEDLWPYDISRFSDRPSEAAYEAAAVERIGRYTHPGLGTAPVFAREHILKAVLSNRQTVAFGFSVYESFESEEVERTGRVPYPGAGEKLLGGHEVLLVGYLRDELEFALCRNSWGTDWGIGGYFLMPWQMILDRRITDDFRTIWRPAGS
jgi:C1A family cysteine protease